LPADRKANLKRVAGMLAHTELTSTDPEATRRFLEKVFGWDMENIKAPAGKLIRYKTPGGAEGSIRGAGPKEAPGVVSYVLVDDVELTAKMVKRGGGELVLPITDVPRMGRFFWFKVPGGPVLAAWQDSDDREG
jgi:uncharacterized protein